MFHEDHNPRKRPNGILFYLTMTLVTIMLLNAFLFPKILTAKVEEVDYATFMKMTNERKISKVEIQTNEIIFSDKKTPANFYKTGVMDDPELVNRLYAAGVQNFGTPIIKTVSPMMSILLTWILPFVFIYFLSQFMMGRMAGKSGGLGNALSFGKSNAKVYVQSTDGIRFDDVAGEDEAKELLTEIVDFLHNPDKYAKIGAQIPKGALLVGPPGTGKTMLAKAVAGEAQVPFFSISGSEFVEMFVGMGAAKVRDLFKQANEKAPCIVFIDEIDTIGKNRNSNPMGGNDEREQTLNQLLTEMDGFDGQKGVLILAATNRPESLDPALLRPGRLDRRIPVELPDQAGREAILKVHGKKIKMDSNIQYADIAKMTPGASGAELANIINEAALRAVRDKRALVSQEDLEESVEVVIAGYQKKNAILSDKEKLIVAYHEIGHALVAALQTHSAPVTKITIIPRTSGALGYTLQVDKEERNLMSKVEIENKIAVYTGGRVAEELVFHSITTGASNDIEQATKLARGMITRFGMNEDFGMVALEIPNSKYLGEDMALTCSPELAAEIDRKVIQLVKEQYEKAENLLKDHIPQLHSLAKHLYEQETITGEVFMNILNEELKQNETDKENPLINED